ncbi:hypothetical protein [Corynebacterium timonense]|uniref:hypothetical protein n=1 Tax=Corynebacterium timonense TaxID=441500 RepID=UPI001E53261F|nr:hypothetical protein [Corynebacterium timonense]
MPGSATFCPWISSVVTWSASLTSNSLSGSAVGVVTSISASAAGDVLSSAPQADRVSAASAAAVATAAWRVRRAIMAEVSPFLSSC